MKRRFRAVVIVLLFLLFLGNQVLAQAQEEDPEIQRARQYIRTVFRITTISDKVLNIALGEKFNGIPWLKWIGFLISGDQIYEEFSIGDYYRGIYLAIQTGFDKILVEALELVGFGGIAKTARLAFSPIERALLEFYDNAVAVAIQNQISLYLEARRLGYSHQEILDQEDGDGELFFTDDGWLYIAGDLTIPPFGAVRPGHNKREDVYDLARDVYLTLQAQVVYSEEKEELGEKFLERVLGVSQAIGSADLALVIDRSGSMTYPMTNSDSRSRLAVAKVAAEAFADLVWPEDYCAVVDFAGDVDVPGQGYFESSNEIKELIRGIEVGSWNGTAIGLALYACFKGFKTLPHPNNQLILLLTDGANNRDPDPFEVIPEDSCPVFTIGFGSGEEYNEPMLQEIAKVTGGMYKHVDFGSPEELADFFAFIGGLMHGASTALKERGYINQEQTVEHRFRIGDDVGLAQINLSWGGSTLGAQIIGPAGALILPDRRGEVYLGFDLAVPSLGQYRIEIKGESVSPGGEPYVLSVATVSSVIANFHPFKSLYALGEAIEIRISAKQKGEDYVLKSLPCTVVLWICDPDGQVLEKEGDLCQYIPEIPGPYLIRAEISGVDLEGEPFQRILEERIWAGSREALTINPDSLAPAPNSVIYKRKPCISAQILGPSSNLNPEAWSLAIDGTEAEFEFNEVDQIISWVPSSYLAFGEHNVILTIVDREGQGPPPLHWSFQIEFNELAVSENITVEEKDGLGEQVDFRDLWAINFPNPFFNETTFAVWLERKAEIQIEVFTAGGQKVASFTFSGQPGHNKIPWQAQNSQGEILASGIYFYSVKTQESSLQRKMLILK